MNDSQFSRHVTIFEGCDGSGKSVAAASFATQTNARYVHLGPFPRVSGRALLRLYVEAMLPAVLGYQDVVLDRCWLSEPIYGRAVRDGDDRIGILGRRILERLALRCGALVVRCDPGPEVCVANYQRRKDQELLTDEAYVRQVARDYRFDLQTDLLVMDYDYGAHPKFHEPEILNTFRPREHPLALATAGQLDAEVLLVGEGFTTHTDRDTLYQWPFGSVTDSSGWLTAELVVANAPENKLLWANADDPHLGDLWEFNTPRHVFALGAEAAAALAKLNVEYIHVPHPQSHKRFHSAEKYALTAQLKEIFK